jgi:CRP-like cAMP-binding protein
MAMLTYEHLEDAIRIVTSLMPNEGVMRVCSRILSLALADDRGGRELLLTQADLGSMCGLSRQSVNKALQRLTDLGAIRAHYGKVDIVDFEKLQALSADQPEAHGQFRL